MKIPTDWPVEVKNGNAVVKIYRGTNTKGDTQYIEFKVAFWATDGKRKFRSFADYGKARRYADTVTASFAKGDAKFLTLSGEEMVVYARATQALKPLGIPLDVAATDYAQAKAKLGAHPLLAAVEFFVRNHTGLENRTVREVVDELLQQRRHPTVGKPASDRYISDMECRLGKFADYARVPIASVGTKDVLRFLDELKVNGRTRFNYLSLLRTLFNHAKTKRYFPRDVDPLEGLPTDWEEDGDIEIFTPEEMQRLLAAARPELIPFLAIGAFAGVRHAELTRLRWEDVKADHIEVSAGKAKTRSRRIIPIQPNLSQWLEPHRKTTGPVVEFVNVTNQIRWLCDSTAEPAQGKRASKAPVKWRHNGLRHSFISYRTAQLKNVNEVSLEGGNTPAIIFSNYRELVTEKQAKSWFAIMPSMPANVIVKPAVSAS